MRIVCRQTILMKFYTLFFSIIGKDDENLLSAAVVIGALRVTTLKLISYINGPAHDFVLKQYAQKPPFTILPYSLMQ